MKSISYLLILSAQLVLCPDTAHSLPQPGINANAAQWISSTSRHTPPAQREDDAVDQVWQKRNPPDLQHRTTGHTERSGVKPKKKKYKAVYRDELDITNNVERPISQAEYHAKALAIEAKRVGKELFHGPVRAIAEMPVSGLVGGVRNVGAACRDTAERHLDGTIYHLGAAVGRVAMGITAVPLYVGTAGVVNAVPAAGRVAKHFVGMTGHGVKQGFNHVVRGKQSEKSLQRQDLLKEAKNRSGVLPKGSGYLGVDLRSAPTPYDGTW